MNNLLLFALLIWHLLLIKLMGMELVTYAYLDSLIGLTCSKASGFWMVVHQLVFT